MDRFDVFLSHNSRDKAGVRDLFAALVERGIHPWLDEENLIPGRRWQDALEEVIVTIPVAAVLVGRDGIGPWENVEMRAILSEFPRRRLPVIPVLLPGAAHQPEDLPVFLRGFTWVDLREGLTEEGLDRLVWGITGERPRRPIQNRERSDPGRQERDRQPEVQAEERRPTSTAKEARAKGGWIFGIDFGTTQSAVAVFAGAQAELIPSADGRWSIPSVVAFTPSGERLVGAVARRYAVTSPKSTIFSIKRLLGRRHGEVGEEISRLPYRVEPAEDGGVSVVVDDQRHSPSAIAAVVLSELKRVAEDYLGASLERVVIAVPTHFDDWQRQALKDACGLAGLTVERLISESSAVALSFGLDREKDRVIAVYKLGGGSFEISILQVGEGVVEILARHGDAHLGGEDIDQRIVGLLLEKFKKAEGRDLRDDPFALSRLKEAAENAKINLSSTAETEINLPFIAADASGPKHLRLRLSVPELEKLVGDLLQRSLGLCRQALRDAGLYVEQIDEVVLVGSQTRMPAIQRLVRDFFGKEPNREAGEEERVAIGAAIQGGVLGGKVKDLVLMDVIPVSLGLETLGGLSTKIIERNTTIPTRKGEIFSTVEDDQTAVEIHVLQGEREMARDNRTLGCFRLVGIPAAPRGKPAIDVTFDIDANGIVHVSAKDLATGNEQEITLGSTSGRSEEEIKRTIRGTEALGVWDPESA